MNAPKSGPSASGARRGASLVVVSIGVSTLMILCMSVLFLTMRSDRQGRAAVDDDLALYLAEAGLEDAAASLVLNSSGNIGDPASPVRFGDGLYWVESTPVDENEFALKATALVGSGRSAVEARVQRAGSGGLTRSLVSNRKLDLKKGFFADSYDSALGTYASQATNNKDGTTYADDGAVIISNDELRLHKDIFVAGDVYAGPDEIIKYKDDPSKFTVTGEIENMDEQVYLPPVWMPAAGPSAGEIHYHGNKDASGYDFELSPGLYHFDNLKLHKDTEAKFVGPATIVVDKKIEFDCTVVIDDTNGPVVFYGGKEAKIKKNAEFTVTSGTATGLWLVLAHPPEYDVDGKKKKSKHKVKVESKFAGVIYAPDGKVEFKKEADVFGSVMANEVKFKKGARFHYDEALSRIDAPFGGDTITVSLLSWRIVEVEDQHLSAVRTDPFLLLGVQRDQLRRPHEAWNPQPFSEMSQFGAWGPDTIGWDDSEDESYDDAEDNTEGPDTGYQ